MPGAWGKRYLKARPTMCMFMPPHPPPLLPPSHLLRRPLLFHPAPHVTAAAPHSPQAHATTALAAEIAARPDACVGGIIFELADEWWKDQAGAPDVHDVGGIAPGSGPPPDDVFNEEWWGLVDVNRTPRLAYYAYAATPNATASPSPRHSPPATGGSAASVRSPVRWRWSATAFGLLLLLLTHC